MHLRKKALLFYRMAATQLNLPFKDEAPFTDQDKLQYDQYLKDLPHIDIDDIIEGVNKFYHKPYFEYKPIGQELARKIFATFLSPKMIVDYLGRSLTMNHEVKDLLIQDILEFWLDHHHKSMGISDYLDVFDKYNLPDRMVRKAQHQILKSIMEGGNDETIKIMSIASLVKLMKSSKKFDQRLLWQAAKHMGPDYYGELSAFFHNRNWGRGELPDFKDKPTLDIYDVSEWLWGIRKMGQLMMRDKFLEIAHKANNEAKQYLRGFLYSYDKLYFILDEELNPMNDQYKSIPFPSLFQVMYGWQEIKPITDIWKPIFEEFNIIPNEYAPL